VNDAGDVLRCRRCGDVIGVYEPLLVVLDGQATLTSRAADPDVAARGTHFHRECYPLSLDGDDPQSTR
jgi:hypothetical protein